MGEHLEDARRAGVLFVAGDQFSVADVTAPVTMDFAARAFAISSPKEHRAGMRMTAESKSIPCPVRNPRAKAGSAG